MIALRMEVVIYEPMTESDTVEDAEDRVLDRLFKAGIETVGYTSAVTDMEDEDGQ